MDTHAGVCIQTWEDVAVTEGHPTVWELLSDDQLVEECAHPAAFGVSFPMMVSATVNHHLRRRTKWILKVGRIGGGGEQKAGRRVEVRHRKIPGCEGTEILQEDLLRISV